MSIDPGRAARLYRRLLALYPREFRERHGGEMARVFVALAAEAARRGRGRWLLFWARTVVDVVGNALAERTVRTARHGGTSGGGGGMDGLLRDGRNAVRSLGRSPGFFAVAVLTIALGIGSNTAIFSVMRAVLLRPLPYPEPDELAIVWSSLTQRNLSEFPLSPPDFRDIRERTASFEDAAAIITFEQPLTGGGEPELITVGGVTHNFFEVIGVPPLLGRSFVASEGEPGPPDVQPGDPGFVNNAVVLGHALWRQRFGEDPGVIGRIIDLGGAPAEVVGVMPEGFRVLLPPSARLTTDVHAWAALRLDYDQAPRGNVFLTGVARLRPGVTPAQAQSDLDQVATYIRSQSEGWETSGYRLDLLPLHRELTREVRPILVALMGAVGFVLLIACANVSNLLLVRASGRQRELAVRAALGGSRLRIVRQLLSESLILSGVGALLGTFLAALGIRLLLLLQPEELPRLDTVAIDAPVLAFTVGAALLAALVFGVLPAVQSSRVDLASSLKDRGHASGLSSQRALRSGVVISEVALSLVLLVGTGLMVRSFVTLQRVDPGFRAEGVLTFRTNLPFQRYQEPEERARFFNELAARFNAIPGVTAATAAFPLPLEAPQFNGRWATEAAAGDPEAFRQADYFAVLPGYFETLETRLLEGRTFTAADDADSASVVVIDEKLAGAAFPGESAVGKRLTVRVSSPESQLVEVIGVVEHQRHPSLVEEGREAVYFTNRFAGAIGGLTWAVRTAMEPSLLASSIRREVARLDPLVPVANLRPMTDLVDRATAATRFALVLIGVFSVLALVLAAVGLYGVLSWTVRRRTAEIGVRMAFGAERAGILRLVVGQGMALSGAGVVLGLAASLVLTRVMTGLLVGVQPRDPLTFVVVPALFLGVAALACALPALRASRVDPSEALRSE